MASTAPSEFPQLRIVVRNERGENLVGILSDTGSGKVAILCHGFQSTKDDAIILNLTYALNRVGLSTFRFDFAGNGESEGSFRYGNYRKEAEDLRAIVLYFLKMKNTISAIIGHSKGGNVVLLYASRYGDVHSVINISGRFALDRGVAGRLGESFMERIKKNGFIDVKDKKGQVEYRVTEESLMDRLTTDMRAACLSIDKSCSGWVKNSSKHSSLGQIQFTYDEGWLKELDRSTTFGSGLVYYFLPEISFCELQM